MHEGHGENCGFPVSDIRLACARDGLAHPSSPGARTQLTAAELIGGHVADFVDMRAFMPNAAAGAPSHLLTGRLVLGKRVAGAFHVRKNDPFDIPIDERSNRYRRSISSSCRTATP